MPTVLRDDASPITLHRHMRLGYPVLSRGHGPYWVTVDGGCRYLLTSDFLIEFPPDGEPRTWSLVVVGWTAVEDPLDVVVVINGAEQRFDLGVITAIAEEVIPRRR